MHPLKFLSVKTGNNSKQVSYWRGISVAKCSAIDWWHQFSSIPPPKCQNCSWSVFEVENTELVNGEETGEKNQRKTYRKKYGVSYVVSEMQLFVRANRVLVDNLFARMGSWEHSLTSVLQWLCKHHAWKLLSKTRCVTDCLYSEINK